MVIVVVKRINSILLFLLRSQRLFLYNFSENNQTAKCLKEVKQLFLDTFSLRIELNDVKET